MLALGMITFLLCLPLMQLAASQIVTSKTPSERAMSASNISHTKDINHLLMNTSLELSVYPCKTVLTSSSLATATIPKLETD